MHSAEFVKHPRLDGGVPCPLRGIDGPFEDAFAVFPVRALVQERSELLSEPEDLFRLVRLAGMEHRGEILIAAALQGVERGPFTFKIRRHQGSSVLMRSRLRSSATCTSHWTLRSWA